MEYFIQGASVSKTYMCLRGQVFYTKANTFPAQVIGASKASEQCKAQLARAHLRHGYFRWQGWIGGTRPSKTGWCRWMTAQWKGCVCRQSCGALGGRAGARCHGSCGHWVHGGRPGGHTFLVPQGQGPRCHKPGQGFRRTARCGSPARCAHATMTIHGEVHRAAA